MADLYKTAGPWYNPKYWRKRTWALVGGSIVVLIIVIAAPVAATKKKNNRYPDYTKLDYTLSDTYSGDTFFSNFDYFTGYDPAHGFVHYVPQETAAQLNLTYASTSTAILRVDTSVGPNSNPDASTGRFSVRVESKRQYDKGLFLFDVKHTPYGCGTWPALWLSDPAENHWPMNGEIDLIEATNNGTDGNAVTLHTDAGCKMSAKRIMTGKAEQADCNNATNSNTGCGVAGTVSTYGTAFNSGGGGVMALELRDEGIRVWQFARDGIPSDVQAGTAPDPSSWSEPLADFPNTHCDIGNHFKNQSIIINIDLCGDLAGATYAKSGCPGTCTDMVANNPSSFTNAFWEFGSFKVYSA